MLSLPGFLLNHNFTTPKPNSMKKFFYLFAILAIVAACGQRSTETDEAQDNNLSIVSTVEFNVVGMTCTGCENTINNALTSLEGVEWAESSHLDSLTTVQFDPGKVNVEQLQDAIRGTGYEVTGFSFVQDEAVEEVAEEPAE